jgi:hypothetical protein
MAQRTAEKQGETNDRKQTILQVAVGKDNPMQARLEAVGLITGTKVLRDLWADKNLPKEVRLAAVENPHFMGAEVVLEATGQDMSNPIRQLIPSSRVMDLILTSSLRSHIVAAAQRRVEVDERLREESVDTPPVPLREAPTETKT